MQQRWRVIRLPQELARRDDGQGLAEYALIILLFAIALVGTVTGFGGSLLGLYQQIVTAAF